MDECQSSYYQARLLANVLGSFRDKVARQPLLDGCEPIEAELAIAEIALRRYALEVGLEAGLIALKPLPAYDEDEED